MKVDIGQCDDKELGDKYNGWQTRYNALKNRKARKAITAEEWQTQSAALLEERVQTIKAIELNVAALHYEKTGVTLEQEKKRRKTDAKDLKTMGDCVGRLVTSNRASSSSLSELSDMHKAIHKDFHEQTEAQKKAMEEVKAEKAENKDKAAQKAAEKAAKLKVADPEKFAELEKAKAEKATERAANAAEKASKKAADMAAKKQQALAKELEQAMEKAANLSLKAMDPEAFARKMAEEKEKADAEKGEEKKKADAEKVEEMKHQSIADSLSVTAPADSEED